MIAWLKGSCQSAGDGFAVIDVRGVGYLVQLSAADALELVPGEPVELEIHTVVREDAFLLYGFRTTAAREMFRTILSISGVGPKSALALLTCLSPAEIARAIHDDQPNVLTVAKGIGKRTAELIVVRLRERLPADLLAGAMEAGGGTVAARWTQQMRDAKSALVNLGFRASAAEKAVLAAAVDSSGEFDHLLRSALTVLRRS